MAWQLPLLSAAIRLKTSDGGSMVRSRFRGLKSNGTKTYAKTIHPVPMGVSVAGVALS